MIRLRFVALLSAFALLLGGYGVYQQTRPGPAFVGASDATHVAASEAMLRTLPTPAGMTLDPYGTFCGTPVSYCFISDVAKPEAASAAEVKALVAQGGKVRHHACGGADLVAHACDTVLDYQGSAVEVLAGPTLPHGNPSTAMRVSVSGADGVNSRPKAASFGSWDTVDPLPAAWTTGVTCTTQTATGCSVFKQLQDASPIINATTADACATVRGLMRGHYYIINDLSPAATATDPGGCALFGSRYRTLGGRDGELFSVHVTTRDAGHVTVGVTLGTN